MKMTDYHFVPARPGSVWALTRYRMLARTGKVSSQTVRWYRDPLIALADLTAEIRADWSTVRQYARQYAPNSDQLAVHLYFLTGEQYGLGTGSYDLELVAATSCTGTVDTRLSGRHPATLEYVFSSAYNDWTCVCGNTADRDGFAFLTAEGLSNHPGSTWQDGVYACNTCYRVITMPYGEITGLLPAGQRQRVADPGEEPT